MVEKLKEFKNAHKWLLLPWIIILIGFTPSYFITFSSEPWAYHIHAISAMGWYILIAVQPYLITRGKVKNHRVLGMIGLFLAGAVVFSALSITPTNVYFGLKGGFPPVFPASFFYGLTFTETLAIIGFGFAVIMAIVKSKNMEEHSTWMLSTVFFGLMPGWGRAVMFPIFAFGWEISQKTMMTIAVPVFLLGIFIVAYRLRKLTHPAMMLAALVNLSMLFISEIGSSEWYQELIINLFKPMTPWQF